MISDIREVQTEGGGGSQQEVSHLAESTPVSVRRGPPSLQVICNSSGEAGLEQSPQGADLGASKSPQIGCVPAEASRGGLEWSLGKGTAVQVDLILLVGTEDHSTLHKAR